MAAELLYRTVGNRSLAPFVLTYDPLGIAPRGSTAIKVRRENPIAEKAKKLVAGLATSGANVSAIARHFSCSRRLLELRFREATGKSLLDAIRDTRLELACKLLRDGNAPIGAVAASCGYASDAALKAVFKRKFGVTMSEWRSAQTAKTASVGTR